MRKIIFLAAGMFALGLDAYVIAGLLPQISQTFNVSNAQTGQAVTVFTLFYALAAPIFAALLAGKPVRLILVSALIIFSLANAASALSSSLTLLLIFRAIAGIGAGLFSPIAIAAAAALVKPEQRGRALGITLGGMSCGTVIGVPIGLLISQSWGWQSALWLVTILGIIGLLGVAFGFPSIPVTPPPSLKQRFVMMYDRRISTTVGITFLTAVASLGLYTYIAPIMTANLHVASITPYLWVWGIGGVIGSFSIGYLIDKTGKPKKLLTSILAILTLSLFSLFWAPDLGLLAFLPILLWGAMGWSSLAPQQHALIKYQPEHGAAALGLNSSCNYLGSAVGSLLGGVFISFGANISYLPLCAALVALLSFSIQLRVNKRNTSVSE